MADLYVKYPNDDFVATHYAESLMNLHSDGVIQFNFYDFQTGEILGDTPLILTVLETVLGRSDYPQAEHLYIHVTEMR